MSEAKHTPGPWRAGRKDMATIIDGVESKWIYGGKNQKKYVAVASGGDVRDWNEVMANAHLIAAAPEMLEELEHEQEECRERLSFENCNACIACKSCSLLRVINKAKGVQE